MRQGREGERNLLGGNMMPNEWMSKWDEQMRSSIEPSSMPHGSMKES